MVAREIREDRSRKLDAVRSAERKRMRRHFHGARAAAGLHHLAHHSMQFGSLWRRSRRCDLMRADSVGDCSEQPTSRASRLKDRTHEIAGRGLAVCPRDAYDAHLAARMPEKGRGERGKRLRCILHHDPWHAGVGPRGGPPGQCCLVGSHSDPTFRGTRPRRDTGVALGNDGNGAGRNRLMREVRPIGTQPTKRHKHHPGFHAARVMRDTAARHVEGS